MDEPTLPGFVNPKPFIALGEGECRWPGAGMVGPDLLCCAAPVHDKFSYCLAHCRIAYAGRPFFRSAWQALWQEVEGLLGT